jgi:hypothetical protein
MEVTVVHAAKSHMGMAVTVFREDRYDGDDGDEDDEYNCGDGEH